MCLIEVIYCASICTKVIPSRRVLNTFCIKGIASFFLSNIKCLSKAILSCVLVPAISFDDIEYIKKQKNAFTENPSVHYMGPLKDKVKIREALKTTFF